MVIYFSAAVQPVCVEYLLLGSELSNEPSLTEDRPAAHRHPKLEGRDWDPKESGSQDMALPTRSGVGRFP